MAFGIRAEESDPYFDLPSCKDEPNELAVVVIWRKGKRVAQEAFPTWRLARLRRGRLHQWWQGTHGPDGRFATIEWQHAEDWP